jgi:hypothetical protein
MWHLAEEHPEGQADEQGEEREPFSAPAGIAVSGFLEHWLLHRSVLEAVAPRASKYLQN